MHRILMIVAVGLLLISAVFADPARLASAQDGWVLRQRAAAIVTLNDADIRVESSEKSDRLRSRRLLLPAGCCM